MKAFKSWPSARRTSLHDAPRRAPSIVAALDTALIAIKIVDAEPESERSPLLPRTSVHTSQSRAPLVAIRNHQDEERSAPVIDKPSAVNSASAHSAPLDDALRWLVALVPTTIFACVSGVTGLAGALAIAAVALAVVAAAGVAHFFEGLATMLLTTDQAMLQFATGARSGTRHLRLLEPRGAPRTSVATVLVRASLSLLDLSCKLLAIGFFKGTLGLSFGCSLYVAVAVPALLWSAQGSTTALYNRSFSASPMVFVLVHAGVWSFALLWLAVTARMARVCSAMLRA